MGFFATQLALPDAQPRIGIDWEDACCPLCDGTRSRLLLEATDAGPGSSGLVFAVALCANCGICFTNPRPTASSMSQFYPHDTKAALPWAPLAHLSRKLLPREASRLLDFGCGSGNFREHMRDRGWHVAGVDPAADGIDNRSGGRAGLGSLPRLESGPGAYDVVTMWEALTYVHNPLDVLRAAHRVLVPNGQLLVAAPNIDSLGFKWFGKVWCGLDLPRRLTHFNPWTLQMMLNRAGFRTGRIRMVRHSDWLRRSAQRSGMSVRWLTHPVPARLAAWYTSLVRRADCIVAVATKMGDGDSARE